MTARQRRFWWAAGMLAVLAAGVSVSFFWLTESFSGRRYLVSRLVRTIDGAFAGRGHLRVGALRELSWGQIVVDSVSIVDSAGVPVVAIARLHGSLDYSALRRGKIHLRSLDLQDLQVDLRRDFTGPWNIAYIISGTEPAGPRGAPGFGDDVRIDTLRLTSGAITTVAPWTPNAVFVGAARDSVIAVRDSLHDLTRVPQGFLERRRIDIARLVGRDGIIIDPLRKPSHLQIDSLRGRISDPPVRIAAAAGRVDWTPDSLWMDLPAVNLPSSSGSARGRVWWNQPGAVRYDVAITADAAMSDLRWIWDVLPDSGRGSAQVRLRTLESADDAEYSLRQLDVVSQSSRMTGRLTVVSRPAVLSMQDVDLSFDPISTDLLRRLSYGAVPAEVNGRVRGRLVAESGGRLDNFTIDRLDARFEDDAVAGAISSLRASGNVVLGVAPAARNVMVDAMSVDLRSVRALSPAVPAVDGRVSGRARVQYADLSRADVRDLGLTWTDDAGNASTVRGNARVAYGGRVPSVDLALSLDPLAMRALSRVDTALHLESALVGRLVATGPLDSLRWSVEVSADAASSLRAAGTASWRTDRWRVDGTATARDIDATSWIRRVGMPQTAIRGTLTGTAAGTLDTAGRLVLETARGRVTIAQAEGNERPAFDLLASAELDGTRVRVDSAIVHIGGVTLDARGALGRGTLGRAAPVGVGATDNSVGTTTPSARVVAVGVDTLIVSATADSLEAVQRQLSRLAASVAPLDSAGAASLRSFASDTLRGDASVSGYLVGSVDDFDATLALGARAMQFGAIRVGRVFGSLRALNVRTRPSFEGTATADEINGIGAIRIASSEFKIQNANPDSGSLVLDASSVDDAHLVVRGSFVRRDGATTIVADSLRFLYDSLSWRSARAIRVVSDARGLTIDSLELRSSRAGKVTLYAIVPKDGAISGALRLEQFPVGEASAFALGTRTFSGLLTGDVSLRGSRMNPLIDWRMVGDSLGAEGVYLPPVIGQGRYADRRMLAQATIADSLGGRLQVEARVPIDLSIATVEKRLLTDSVDADVTADSLRLEALAVRVAGVDRIRGSLTGHLRIGGSMQRPVGTGTMLLSQFSARSRELGIEPVEGRAQIRAAQDSLILESFRMRSGRVDDTLMVRGALRYALDEPVTMVSTVTANNFIVAKQRYGSAVAFSGTLDARGPLRRPEVTGSLLIPAAVLAIDPFNASTALDLTSESARAFLAASELPSVSGAASSFSNLGRYVTVSDLRVELGNEVWVRTPESIVKLSGRLNLVTRRDALVPEGEIVATRGQYRLDLNVASRGFTVDSGRVRFFGDAALAPTLDVTASHSVRLATGEDIPVRVQISGNIENPVLTLSSTDPLYAAAPESEIISLLIFGAPTFALDGQRQSTVNAVASLVVPAVGARFEDGLRRLLPFNVNTLQISTGAGQTSDASEISSLLSSVSISAGKQIGDRTYLRVNTGLCRGTAFTTATGLWAGLAAEYRISRGLTAQLGVDPGAAPCSRIDGGALTRLQFGFDLFREWIF